jgi:hypothetical protein
MIFILLGYALVFQKQSLTFFYVQLFTLYWTYLGILGFLSSLIYLTIRYYGLRHRKIIWVIWSWIMLFGFSITIVLDIDHFEVNLHAIIALVMVGTALHANWTKLTTFAKRNLLYVTAWLVTLSTLMNWPIFQWLYKPQCLYLTPDGIPLVGALAQCQQVSWFSPLLWPLYATGLAAAGYILYALLTYWRNTATKIIPAIILTAGIVATVLLPILWHDINNHGELDVLGWQVDINEAYQEILGRAPERKDLEFYASSRAYKHMSRVRDTLYHSPERKQKIILLYQAIVQRSPTEDELNQALKKRQSIETITAELQAKNSQPAVQL